MEYREKTAEELLAYAIKSRSDGRLREAEVNLQLSLAKKESLAAYAELVEVLLENEDYERIPIVLQQAESTRKTSLNDRLVQRLDAAGREASRKSVQKLRKEEVLASLRRTNDIAGLLKWFGLERWTEDIHRAAKKSMRLIHAPRSSRETLSRIGGNPAMSPSAIWPTTSGGPPLSFLCQIELTSNMQEHLGEELPSGGLLSFFICLDEAILGIEKDDSSTWRVLYTPRTDGLQAMKPPESLPPDKRLREIAIILESETTYPDSLSSQGRKLPWCKEDQYHDFCQALYMPPPVHRILGHPQIVQEDPITNSIREQPVLNQEYSDWITLLQIDSDAALGLEIGDSGMIHFLIERSSLQSAKFDQARAVVQWF